MASRGMARLLPNPRAAPWRSGILGAFIIVLSLAACGAQSTLPSVSLEIERASGGSATVRAELAVSDQEQRTGYMRRKVIPQGTGMLFVKWSDRRLNFWMKDTPHPLSIAYIDSEGRIRDILDMEPLSLATVSSSVSVRYALEVPQGDFARLGVAVGDRIGKASLEKALEIARSRR